MIPSQRFLPLAPYTVNPQLLHQSLNGAPSDRSELVDMHILHFMPHLPDAEAGINLLIGLEALGQSLLVRLYSRRIW